MDSEKAGEDVAEVAADMGGELPIVTNVQEFTDRFNGQNVAFGRPGRGTALAQIWAGLAEEIVNSAEDCYYDVLEAHGRLVW